jgi:hypothetical protein
MTDLVLTAYILHFDIEIPYFCLNKSFNFKTGQINDIDSTEKNEYEPVFC